MTHHNLHITEDRRLGAGQATAKALGDGGPYHILAASSLADERTRVLKHGDTFAVFDHYGDIKPGGLGEEGLYHEGTRYLSCLLLELEGSRPFFLELHRPGRERPAHRRPDQPGPPPRRPRCGVPLGTLHLALKKFLWQGACYQQLRVKNHGLEPVETSLRAALRGRLRRHLRGPRHASGRPGARTCRRR